MSDDLQILRAMHDAAKSEVEQSDAYQRMRALAAAINRMEHGAAITAAVASMSEPPRMTIEGYARAFVLQKGEPQRFREIYHYIRSVKGYPDDQQAKANISSILSKGKVLKSVEWDGHWAWWPNDVPMPKKISGAMP